MTAGRLSSGAMNDASGSAASPAAPASPLSSRIDELWEFRSRLTPDDTSARAEVTAAIDQIDAGQARVAQVAPGTGEVVVDERAKRAILLAFRRLPMTRAEVGQFRYQDRVPLKTRLDGVRVVPGAIARWGAYIAPGVILMPAFVNIGAYVDEGTMVDTWATVGSCAQIGKNVHLSGGVGIGGVPGPPRSSSRTARSSVRAASWSKACASARAPCSERGPSSPRRRQSSTCAAA